MKPTYHIVSHSHWDREWYKSFEQFRSMLVMMVDDLLDLLERDPSYACFTLDGQAIVLEDYLAVRPEREQEIRRLVMEGRLVIGPWYVLPDEFLVSAEASVRNLLMGRAVTQRYGRTMEVGYIPDSFGHIAMMPAILRGFGIDSAIVYRGFGGEPGQNRSEYTWVSPDGSRVLLTHLFRHGYSAGYFNQENDEQILRRFAEIKNELDQRATTSQRLLLNGGDHHWPDPRLPKTLQLIREKFEGEFVHSTIPRYVERVKAEAGTLQEVQGEMRFGYRYAFAVLGGVYSSRITLKQRNWHCQNLLQRYAEPLNAIAVASGGRSMLPLLRHAWRTILQNHPHDSICGCSIDPVHREMMTRFAAVEDTGNAIADASLNQLIPADDLAARDDRYLFFFNPSPRARSEAAGAELKFYLQDIVVGLNPDVKVDPRGPSVRGFILRDAWGKEIPCQILRREEGYDITYSYYNYPRQTYAETFTVLVDAKEIPPLGYAGLTVERASRFPKYDSPLKTGKRFIQNDFLRVEIGPRGDCTIRDLIRKTVYRGLNQFEDTGDVGDEYNYSYPRRDRRVISSSRAASVRVVERGPLRSAIEVRMTMRVPRAAAPDRKSRSTQTVLLPIRTTYTLTASSRSVEIETVLENRAEDHRFRALFPTGCTTRKILADSQFCLVEREQQKYDVRDFTIEHPAAVAPMQRFVTVRHGRRGMTLLSLGLPEYELMLDSRGTIALTLLRCVGLLAGEDLITRPGGKAGWHNETPEAQCPGRHVFRYALIPHGGDEREMAELVNGEAERFHLPLLPVRRKNESPLPLRSGFCAIDNPRLVLSAVKETEEGRGIAVRFWNPLPTAQEATLRFEPALSGAWLARLDEQRLEEIPVINEHEIGLRVGPAGIWTCVVECAGTGERESLSHG